MYAVIETGGKQHKVEKGMILSVDLLKDEVLFQLHLWQLTMDEPIIHEAY